MPRTACHLREAGGWLKKREQDERQEIKNQWRFQLLVRRGRRMWSERERQSTERGMLSSASLPLSSCDCNVAPARDSERKTSSFQAKRNFFFLRFSGERQAASSVAGDDSTTSERESLRGVWRRTVGLVEGIRDPLHSRSQGARETFAYSLNQKRAPAAVAHQQTESESRWHTYTQRQTVGRGRAKERARERNGAEADDA